MLGYFDLSPGAGAFRGHIFLFFSTTRRSRNLHLFSTESWNSQVITWFQELGFKKNTKHHKTYDTIVRVGNPEFCLQTHTQHRMFCNSLCTWGHNHHQCECCSTEVDGSFTHECQQSIWPLIIMGWIWIAAVQGAFSLYAPVQEPTQTSPGEAGPDTRLSADLADM